MSPHLSFLRRSRQDQTETSCESSWFFNEEDHAHTVPLIDRFSRAINYFSCRCNCSSDNAFFSGTPCSCVVMSFNCIHGWVSPTHPSLTSHPELLMTWLPSNSTGPREGEVRLGCLHHEESCMAALIPETWWSLQVIASHPPLLCQVIPLHPLATG